MEATMHNVRPNQGLSDGMARANNLDFNFNGNHYLMNRAPDYYVYVYNVSEQFFVVSRPPIIKLMTLVGKNPTSTNKAVICARFPQPLTTMQSNVDSNEVTPLLMDCRRFVMDLINPDNLGFDQNSQIEHITSIGNDLGAKGVFWSLNGPGALAPNLQEPTQQEITDAILRMEKHYRKLVEKANTVQASKPADLPDTLTPEHFHAADYLTRNFGNQFAWHQTLSRLEDCEQCGSKVKAGIAFHRSEDMGICVRDWTRTVASGARTRAQAYEATGDAIWLPKTVEAAPVVAPVAVVPVVAPKKDIPTEGK